MKKTLSVLALVASLFVVPVAVTVPAIAADVCITTALNGDTLSKPICLSGAASLASTGGIGNCPAVIPATYSGNCYNATTGQSEGYQNGVKV